MSWKTAPNATLYLPTLNATEAEWHIPPDLLARIAFEESSWRDDVVNGTDKSSAGCVGLMQLNPIFYPEAGKNWQADVTTAARLLVSDYCHFGDWQLAIAAYNDGAGNIDMYLHHKRPLPAETLKYVSQVVADVPSLAPSSTEVAMDDPNTANVALSWIWRAVLSVLGAVLFWNWRRMVSELDGKTDQKDFDDHRAVVRDQFTQMQDAINRMLDQQSQHHQANTERLDSILREVYRPRGRQ